MSFPWKQGLAALIALAVIHAVLYLLPGPSFSGTAHVVLFAANTYVLYCALTILQKSSGRQLAFFVLGYMLLFILLMVIMERKSLFVLLIVVYAGLFGSRVLLGFFAIFVLSFVVFQPYAFETFVPLGFVYVVVYRARKQASGFALVCLAVGLVALAVVLFPLVHLILQDSAQTLFQVLSREEVKSALWLSLASSAIATLVVALWGIPLAYAMARLNFSGKKLIESLIDVPILVPQSVAGIALIVLLGPGSPIGQALDDMLGIQIAGRLLGIVLAQIFVSSPFLIKTAMTAFEAVPERLELASRTLGASALQTFWRISLPLASRGILVGMILAFARAISEFGSIILFASSPVTAPVLVHTEFLRAGATESRPIASLLLLMCLWIFIVLQFGQTLMPFAWQKAKGRPKHD